MAQCVTCPGPHLAAVPTDCPRTIETFKKGVHLVGQPLGQQPSFRRFYGVRETPSGAFFEQVMSNSYNRAVVLTIRPRTEADDDWLFDLHRSTMGGYIQQTWGWDEGWQRQDFAKRLARCGVSIIETDGLKAAAAFIERDTGGIFLTDLQVHPERQGRGIGTWFLRQVIAEAARLGQPVELVVLQVNARAKRLYERLGFHVVERTDPFIRMRHAS
jgi:ribosomal protein S18 acetylase RimI-like enzyme